jgi:flagellum-specific peptidoglycan hydrolase FlgJ
MRIKLLAYIVLFLAIFLWHDEAYSQAKSQDVLNYIERYKDIAMREMQEYKIPASITLAQGLLESGNGKSELARKSNNHFGIKCHSSWKGKRTYYDDDAKGECFRVYDDPAQSYRDHSLFLANGQRYAFLFELKITDYKGWAKGLKKADCVKFLEELQQKGEPKVEVLSGEEKNAPVRKRGVWQRMFGGRD